MRHVAQICVCHTLNAWGELELAEEHLDRWAPDWTASGSTQFRMYAPAVRATLSMAAGRFGEAARLFDEALHVQPLDEWHWSSYVLTDARLVARVRSGTPVASRDLVEPWKARQSSGLAFATSRAALITAFALDHLGASELADDFKQLLATTSPDVLAGERAALRIPDDYVLQITDRRTPAARRPPRPPRRVRRPHQRPAHQLTCDIGSTRSHQRRTQTRTLLRVTRSSIWPGLAGWVCRLRVLRVFGRDRKRLSITHSPDPQLAMLTSVSTEDLCLVDSVGRRYEKRSPIQCLETTFGAPSVRRG